METNSIEWKDQYCKQKNCPWKNKEKKIQGTEKDSKSISNIFPRF